MGRHSMGSEGETPTSAQLLVKRRVDALAPLTMTSPRFTTPRPPQPRRSVSVWMVCAMTVFLGLLVHFVSPYNVQSVWSSSILPKGEETASGLYFDPATREAFVWIPFNLLHETSELDTLDSYSIQCHWPGTMHATTFEFSGQMTTYGKCPLPDTSSLVYEDTCVELSVQNCVSCKKRIKRCAPVTTAMPTKTQDVSICTVFRDQGSFLAEWLAYHRLIGFDHFFLYDNLSSDRGQIERILKPYIEQGIVTYIHWPEVDSTRGWQTSGVNDCFYRFRHVMGYTAHIDMDEFFALPPVSGETEPPLNAMKDTLDALFSNYGDQDEKHKVWSIHIPWAVFGSSGYKTRPPGLVIENYWKRMDDILLDVHNDRYQYYRLYDNTTVHAYKSIAIAQDFKWVSFNPHFFISRNREHTSRSIAYNDFYINHYHIKSKQDWLVRYAWEFKEGLLDIDTFEELEAKQFENRSDTYLARYAPLIHQTLYQNHD